MMHAHDSNLAGIQSPGFFRGVGLLVSFPLSSIFSPISGMLGIPWVFLASLQAPRGLRRLLSVAVTKSKGFNDLARPDCS